MSFSVTLHSIRTEAKDQRNSGLTHRNTHRYTPAAHQGNLWPCGEVVLYVFGGFPGARVTLAE